MSKNSLNTSNSIFWSVSLFSIFYLSYRYIFQINDTGTSPTYSDTPAILQYGKYTALLLFVMVSYVLHGRYFIPIYKRGINIKYNNYIASYIIIFISFYPFLKYFPDYSSKQITFPVIVLIAYLITCSIDKIYIKELEKIIYLTAICTILVNIIQVFLFLKYDRLPALAYENSLSVRFGSFLDDPNAIAPFLFLFIGYFIHQVNNIKSMLIFILILASIFLTQSLTALIILFSGIILSTILFNKINNSIIKNIIFIFYMLMLFILIFYFDQFYDLLEQFYINKESSIEFHALDAKLSDIADIGILSIGSFDYKFSESWWVNSIYNYGIFWTLFCMYPIILFILSLIKIFNDKTKKLDKNTIFGLIFFSCYIFIGSFSLPFYSIFPVNFFFFLFFFLFNFNKIIYT